MEEKEFMSVLEVASHLGVSEDLIYNLVIKNQIPPRFRYKDIARRVIETQANRSVNNTENLKKEGGFMTAIQSTYFQHRLMPGFYYSERDGLATVEYNRDYCEIFTYDHDGFMVRKFLSGEYYLNGNVLLSGYVYIGEL